jgi:hypothetical protein
MADAVKTFLLFYFVLFFLTEISGQKHKKENKIKQKRKNNKFYTCERVRSLFRLQ